MYMHNSYLDSSVRLEVLGKGGLEVDPGSGGTNTDNNGSLLNPKKSPKFLIGVNLGALIGIVKFVGLDIIAHKGGDRTGSHLGSLGLLNESSKFVGKSSLLGDSLWLSSSILSRILLLENLGVGLQLLADNLINGTLVGTDRCLESVDLLPLVGDSGIVGIDEILCGGGRNLCIGGSRVIGGGRSGNLGNGSGGGRSGNLGNGSGGGRSGNLGYGSGGGGGNLGYGSGGGRSGNLGYGSGGGGILSSRSGGGLGFLGRHCTM